jgi:hypothetical protein
MSNKTRKAFVACTATLLMLLPTTILAQKTSKGYDMVLPQGQHILTVAGSMIDNKIILGNRISYNGPSVSISNEYGVKGWDSGLTLGIGAMGGYGEATENYTAQKVVGWDNTKKQDIYATEERERRWTRLYFGPMASAHYAIASKTDLYARTFFCVDLGGVFKMNQELNSKRPKSLQFNYGLTLGAEYMVTKRIGLCIEAGLAQQWVSAGIVIPMGRSDQSDLFYRTPKGL